MPKFENEARKSVLSEAATVNTPVALAISYPELQKGWSEQLGVTKLNAVR